MNFVEVDFNLSMHSGDQRVEFSALTTNISERGASSECHESVFR